MTARESFTFIALLALCGSACLVGGYIALDRSVMASFDRAAPVHLEALR